MLKVADALQTAYPGACAGLLLMRSVSNPKQHPALEKAKQNLENELQQKYAGCRRAALKEINPMQQYTTYFKRFKKTYPVLLQLESLLFKGRSLPSVSALVEAMFMAELKNLLLTAGHDWAALQQPLKLDVARGGEKYLLLSGQEKALLPRDLFMADAQGIISSIIYGPDMRTQINPETKDVLFAVYAVPGIGGDEVQNHLQEIRDNVLLFAPQARVELLQVYQA